MSLKNEFLDVRFDTKGRMPIQAELRQHKAQDNSSLSLCRRCSLNLPLLTANQPITVNTEDLFFDPIAHTDSTLTMRLAIDSASYIDFVHTPY